MKRALAARALLALAACIAAPAQAVALAGGASEPPDFSNDRANPTPITLLPGSNPIRGTVGGADSTSAADRDYFKVDVPSGWLLGAIVLGPGTSVGGAFSFIGMQAGGQITVPPDTASGAGLLGWHLFGSADIGTNLLVPMGFGFDKIGFTPPLGEGTYSFWVQELALGTYAYDFDFQLSAVPEPGPPALALAGLGVLALLVRARRPRA